MNNGKPSSTPHEDVILATGVRAGFHSAVLFSIYTLFSGHSRAGGGFIAGLVAACAMLLVTIALKHHEVPRLFRLSPTTYLGGGLIFAIMSARVGIVTGQPLGQVLVHELSLGYLGDFKLTSVLLLEIGVYLIVLGVARMLLRAFFEDGFR